MLPMQEARVLFLVRELRSHISCSTAKTNKTKNKQNKKLNIITYGDKKTSRVL